MTTRVWISNRFDNIYAPYQWLPYGTPQPYDVLVMFTGAAYLGSGNLFGETLYLDGLDSQSQPAVIVSGSASLAVDIAAQIYPDTGAHGTVKVVGHPSLELSVVGSPGASAFGTVSIEPYSTWQGSFNTQNGSVSVTAPATSLFANVSSLVEGPDPAIATIDAQVTGVGTFTLSYGGSLIFDKAVGSSQTIQDASWLVLNDVKDFHASINLTPSPDSFITLADISADSFTYDGSTLSLFSGGHDVKDLTLHVDQLGVSVSRSGSNLFVTTGNGSPQTGPQPILNAAAPSGPPPPGSGTVTTRIWHAFKFDNIYAANEWFSYGTPQPGDTLVMFNGGAYIESGTVAGDTVELAGLDAATQPLVVVSGSAAVNLAVTSPFPFTDAYGSVQIVGHPHVDLTVDGGYGPQTTEATIAIEPYSTWQGTLSVSNADVSVTAPATSVFELEQGFIGNGHTEINAQLLGIGTLTTDVFTNLILDAGVGAGQILDTAGQTVINDVPDFHGSIILEPTFNSTVTLSHLQADSFTYQGDVLSLFLNGVDVKDLNLQIPDGLAPSILQSGDDLILSYTFPDEQHMTRPLLPLDHLHRLAA